MMLLKRTATAVLTALLFFSVPLCAKELSSKIDKAAQKLASSGRIFSGAALAVFPFQADKPLAMKRVNLAISELFSAAILKQGTFKIAERSQFEEILKEQKLALSGAMDSRTAAEVGKLIGAKLLLLGNVVQLGNSYQVTAKLIDAETGEMLGSEIFEIPVKTFDEDAGRYLVLVPDTQAIGLYLAAGYAPVKSKKLQARDSTTHAGNRLIPTNGIDAFTYAGVGANYTFLPAWDIDAAFMLSAKFSGGSSVFSNYDPSGPVTNYYKGGDRKNSMTRVSINHSFPLSRKFKMKAGLGMLAMSVAVSEKNESQSGGSAYCGIESEKVNYRTNFASVALEWKPQARIGASVRGAYNFTRKDYKSYGGVSGVWSGELLQQFSFPQVIVEGIVSVYF